MTSFSLEKSPLELCVKLRDKLAPRLRLSLRTSDGFLPFDSADLVATQLRQEKFERAEISILESILPFCATAVDVGANLGLYTLLASRRMPQGKVFSFEASPIEFDKLCWTVRKNGLANVTAVHSAVSSDVGETTIHESLFGAGALNRLDRPAKSNGQWRATQVRKVSLDHYFAVQQGSKINPIDLIKIDVEGHELPVIEGAIGILRSAAPVLMIEVNESRMSERSTPERIFEFMRANSYDMYAIDEVTARLHLVKGPSTEINYFAVPSARKDALVAKLLERAAP